MKILVLMAGDSSEFYKEGFKYPKYLFEINGKPLVEHVINRLSPIQGEFLFIINEEDARQWHLDDVLRLIRSEAEVVVIEGATKGAACSALYAIDKINNDEELVIANGDQILDIDWGKAFETLKKNDGGTVIFESVHPRWSYVSLDANRKIVQAEEKRPISKNATAGIYYYKRGRDFVEGASNMLKKSAHVGDLYYICPVFNEMILKNKVLGVYSIERPEYHSLANVEDVREYENFLRKQ